AALGMEAGPSDMVRAFLPDRQPEPLAQPDLSRAPHRVPLEEYLRLPAERSHGLGRTSRGPRPPERGLRASPRAIALLLPFEAHGGAPLETHERHRSRARRARGGIQQSGQERAPSDRLPLLDLLHVLAPRARLVRGRTALGPPDRVAREEASAQE